MVDPRHSVAFHNPSPVAGGPLGLPLAGERIAPAARPPGERAAPPGAGIAARTEESRTHLEVQLAGIWAEILKLPRIGLTDDFFDLGGDSLLATEMLHRVEQDCGCRVDPGRVLNGLTVERLATEIVDGSRETLARPVVQVQSGTGRTPFFFLHGDFDSGGFYCRRLARSLGPDVTMYAVQPHGINGAPVPDTVEVMAAERLQGILEIQPAGPYRIGGFCGGGIIAYEVARQLVARGEQVETVLLIDATPPNQDHRSLWTAAGRIATVLQLSPAMQRALFLRLKWYRDDLRASGRTGISSWIALLWDKLRSVAMPPTPGVAGPGAAPDPAGGAELKKVWKQYHQRMSIHVPGVFPGHVVLLRSNRLEGQRLAEAAAGWKRLAAGVDVHHIPGDHHTCVTTHAPDLAARMRPYLQG